jgi:RNA polymerase sigma-70 factor, ECF subfamily
VLKEIFDSKDGAHHSDLANKDDRWLVSAAQGGDHAAFERLIERYKKMIVFKATQIINSREDAEDLAQQTFHKAFVHLQEFEGRSSFSTWLVRIALNQALMLRRNAWRCRVISIDEPTGTERTAPPVQVEDSRPDPEQDYSQRERNVMLYHAIKKLHPRMRMVVQMYDLEEQSAKETARKLGLSVAAVKSRLSRGRRLIRENLKRQVGFKCGGSRANFKPAA